MGKKKPTSGLAGILQSLAREFTNDQQSQGRSSICQPVVGKFETALICSTASGECGARLPIRIARHLEQLAERLCCDYGRGLSATNLWDMKRFHGAFGILQTVSRESALDGRVCPEQGATSGKDCC